MTGVEILATQEVATAWGFYWSGFWVLIAAGLILGIFSWIANQDDIGVQVLLAVVALVSSFAGALFVGFFAADRPATEYETQYKVTISDEVQMNDFLDCYEIVSQEGKIYTVRERNGDEDGR